MHVINLSHITKEYTRKNEKIIALEDVNYTFLKGKFYAIMGHSGSGKSTLLNIMGLIQGASSGTYILNQVDVSTLKEEELAKRRMKSIGFVFQEFYLDEYLKAIENVMVPMLINKEILPENREKVALELLTRVGLEDRKDHFPKEMSGGEQQRVAIARALANGPDIILADEPTGNLDEENEQFIFSILKQLSEEGKCVIVVSHSNAVLSYADEVLHIKKGHLEVG